MDKEYNHVFIRNMDTINVTLEHILNNANSLPREIIEGNFGIIRTALAHCEELALGKKTVGYYL